MCGIVGYSCNNPKKEHYEILKAIIRQSKIRGLHSFGFSFYDSGVRTLKYHDIEEVQLPLVNKIIYHNRYSTSGDYKNHSNNQPITIGNMSLVFNGVLDMRTKAEMETYYGITMETDNDGEIVLKLCGSNTQKIQEYVQKTMGSFAGLILTQDNVMLAIRNRNRPLWMLKHDSAIFYASTRDIFKRVNRYFDPEQLEPYKVYES
jgi:glucosamine 6-phosphate synthetase-like amidotransferase/phosphosugar isomerase protein